MKDLLKAKIFFSEELKNIYNPVFLRMNNSSGKAEIEQLLKDPKLVFVKDEMHGQLKELIKCRNPNLKLKDDEYDALIQKHLNGVSILEYGVWVYYPWNGQLVHLLDEDEFVEVRTNRNNYKITTKEQNILKAKKIGIVGLSVGQSIALTIATERICGELKLADFDIAELSNLNRIKTGTHNLGINKTVIAAREIFEIDPFLKITLFIDGLNKENIDDFFTGQGKLDLFIEVCDGLDIKIESRFKARELGIPVVMDTNDRGMLDIERFDLEPQRPILHGLADGLNPDNIKNLTNEEKIPYILKMIGVDTLSTRLKASMMEVEQSINTWPQLASSVTLGGAITTDISRRILLDQHRSSGRYYIDLDQLIDDKTHPEEEKLHILNPFLPLSKREMDEMIHFYFDEHSKENNEITAAQLDKIIDAAIIAPSAGNNQPWKWVFSNGLLFLFHDKYRSWSWGDYFEMGAHMSLGAALENVEIQATALDLKINVKLFPLKNKPSFIASIQFSASNTKANTHQIQFAKDLYRRYTNRKLAETQKLDPQFFQGLKLSIADYPNVKFHYTENEVDLIELADIIAECDKIRLLNELGHAEFYHEIRWNRNEAENKKDGIELEAVDLSMSEKAGFSVAKDLKAVKLLSEWDKGNALKKLSIKAVRSASAMALFTIKDFNHRELIEVGKAVEKAWIFANQKNVSVHPMLSPAFFFNRLEHGKSSELTDIEAQNLSSLKSRLLKVFPIGQSKEVFIIKLGIAEDMGIRSLRKDKNELFYIL
jgi:hypothetical protein